jgi:hypothetical protein
MTCKHRKCSISEEIKQEYKDVANKIGVTQCCPITPDKQSITITLSKEAIDALQNMDTNATVAEIIEEILKGKHD